MNPALPPTVPPPLTRREGTSLLLALDESFAPDLAVVGGIILDAADAPDVEAAWRDLKAQLGMGRGGELKYNMPSHSPDRAALDAAGYTVRVRQPRIAQFIAESGATLLATVVPTPGADAVPEAYYLDGFRWAVQRFANHIQWEMRSSAGPHQVLTDMPPSPPKLTGGESEHVRGLFEDPACAAQHLYRQMILDGYDYPNGTRQEPLAKLGFASSLSVSKSAYSDLLQMADFVAGCVRDFANHAMQPAPFVGTVPDLGYRAELLGMLAPAFRRARGGSVLRRGFDLHPANDLQARTVRTAFLSALDTPTAAVA